MDLEAFIFFATYGVGVRVPIRQYASGGVIGSLGPMIYLIEAAGGLGTKGFEGHSTSREWA